MSDVRFSSHIGMSPLSQSWMRPTSGFSNGSGEVCLAPTVPNLSSGTVGQLLDGSNFMDPNLFSGAPLIGLQAQTASSVLNPSASNGSSEPGVKEGLQGAGTANEVTKLFTRSSGRIGALARSAGPGLGFVGSAYALPSSVSGAASAIGKAYQSGEWSDITAASAATTSAGSTASLMAKTGIESFQMGAGMVDRYRATSAGANAFRQATPGASKAVVKAASQEAARSAMAEATEKAARRATTAAAETAAKATGTLAQGAGVAGRQAAKTALREGGEAAAKAATKAVATSALKTGAKAAGRFVPGLNVAIAGFDTATAAATLADPKASTGKKVTSVITAAGSIVAATNIPIVSQIGGAVSAVSSFIGSFF